MNMRSFSIITGALFLLLAAAIFSANSPTKSSTATEIRIRQAQILHSTAKAQLGGDITWDVISSGGRTSSGGSYAITGTACQTAIGQSTGGSYAVNHGFWQNFDSCLTQSPGDVDNDGDIDISDLVYLVDFLCSDGPAPDPLANGDPTGDCIIDTLDIAYLDAFLNQAGPAPVECTCIEPLVGSCGSPDICDSSTCDPAFLVCPGGDTPFRVYLKDNNGDPVPGISSVFIEFFNCEGMVTCPFETKAFTRIGPDAPSDENGMIFFNIAGGGCPLDGYALVQTSTCIIDSVPVRSFDTNGDLVVTNNDFNFSVCNDYTGNGVIGPSDYELFERHKGHNCNLDLCDLIGADLTIEPEDNLSINVLISINLDLSNNSDQTCHIGAVGFFAEGFGQEGETFIETISLDSALVPGQLATVSTEYIIPDSGDGCIIARFTTDCCESAIEESYCFNSYWVCGDSDIICYDFTTHLFDVPVIDTQWTHFLPPSGWTFWLDYAPAFPLYTADSVMFRLCTPIRSHIGDTASAVITACYNENCTDFQSYYARVQITSQTGDVNCDCDINVGDVVYMINHIFKGGPPPCVEGSGDVNCDDFFNVGDPVFLIAYIFKGGPPPCFGFPMSPEIILEPISPGRSLR